MDKSADKLSPQQRGAQKRAAARVAKASTEPAQGQEPVTVQADYAYLTFTLEADMLVIARALSAIGRASTVGVLPFGVGFTLTHSKS